MFTAHYMQSNVKSNVFWAVCNVGKLGDPDTTRDAIFAVTRPL